MEKTWMKYWTQVIGDVVVPGFVWHCKMHIIMPDVVEHIAKVVFLNLVFVDAHPDARRFMCGLKFFCPSYL